MTHGDRPNFGITAAMSLHEVCCPSASAHAGRRFKRKNGWFWRAQFCTEVAHPTRFERVAFAFGGQQSLKKVCLASKQVFMFVRFRRDASLALEQSEKSSLPPLMSGSLRTAAAARDCTRWSSGVRIDADRRTDNSRP